MNNSSEPIYAELAISPEGHVYLDSRSTSEESLPPELFEKLKSLFLQDASLGLLRLGLEEFTSPLPPRFLFWQTFSRQFITKLCKIPQHDNSREIPEILPPSEAELKALILEAPCMKGIEYLTTDVLNSIWKGLMSCFQGEFKSYAGTLQEYLKNHNARWNLVGKVCFHLAENKNDANNPFAFLATYTSQLSPNSSPQHLPLKKALQDYAGEKNHSALLTLLLPVQKTANQSPFIKNLVDTGALFQTLKWKAREAHQFLMGIPLMDA